VQYEKSREATRTPCARVTQAYQAADHYGSTTLFKTPQEELTAIQLSKYSTILAKRMKFDFKVENGVVMILAPPCLEHPIALFASAKAGIAFACVNDSMPPSYWPDMITDFQVKIFFFHPVYLMDVLKAVYWLRLS
jgi:acyl-coenzyme A synthetase/AMP-(fatty) acid ligase